MTGSRLLVEVLPDIDVEIRTNRDAQRAEIAIINKRLRTRKSLGSRTLSEAFTMFHNLIKAKRRYAERKGRA